MGFGLTPLFGDRRGFMPPQLKTKNNSASFCIEVASILFSIDLREAIKFLLTLKLTHPYGEEFFCKNSMYNEV
jgi:hypothetical protein